MKNSRNLLAMIGIAVCGSLITAHSAMAQASANPSQLLDTVTLTGKDFAIVPSEDGPGNFDPLVPQDSAFDFLDCVASNTSGLTCIDNDEVRHWPIPVATSSSSVLFECDNNDLPFNTRKGNGCTAIARDSKGSIYLGGRLNGTANILIQVVADSNGMAAGGCPSVAYAEFSHNSNYFCWATIETGRPRIEDIDVIEGSLTEGFTGGDKQLLVLEEKKTVLIYRNFEDDPQDTIVDEIASGKRDFGLNRKEQILNAMLMNYVRPDESSDFFIVVATDDGRLIAINDDGSPSGADPFTLPDVTSPYCAAGEESFDVAQGPAGGVIYATDRNGCTLHTLDKLDDGSGNFDGFDVDQSFTTSTDSGGMMQFAPLAISVSPGIGFDLNDCFPNCNLIEGPTKTATSISDAMVATPASGVVLFHVTGLPHCSWIPETCVEINGGSSTSRDDAVGQLCDDGVLFPLDTTVACSQSPLAAPPAETLVFNVTPFLPSEVTDQIELTGNPEETPPLIFGPEYRAQDENSFLFDALFFVPEPGVATDGVLTLDVDVEELTGVELGCDDPDLLAWDVLVRASERFATFNAAYSDTDENYQGTMINADCINPTRGRSGGISMFPVNFELTPCPATFNVDDDFVSECVSDIDNPDDAVFAKLYVTLYDELLAHLLDRACEVVPPGTNNAPLLQSDCAQLAAIWANGKDKLVKALNATIQPKNSAGSENFGSVQAQLDNYRSKLLSANTSGQPFDEANRVGEQEARLETLDHLLNDKLLPSIPPAGFIEDDDTWAQ